MCNVTAQDYKTFYNETDFSLMDLDNHYEFINYLYEDQTTYAAKRKAYLEALDKYNKEAVITSRRDSFIDFVLEARRNQRP